MGNIQREVLPVRVISLRRRAFMEVKRISMHQPVRPHLKKFLAKFGMGCFIAGSSFGDDVMPRGRGWKVSAGRNHEVSMPRGEKNINQDAAGIAVQCIKPSEKACYWSRSEQ